MISLTLMTFSLILMISYIVYILCTKISSHNVKLRTIFCMVVADMCLVSSGFLFFADGKTFSAIIWLINTGMWLFNAWINWKFYKTLIERENEN